MPAERVKEKLKEKRRRQRRRRSVDYDKEVTRVTIIAT
jgi:hypothetical protein